MKRSCYIGLAATYHDPAIAIVGPDGRVRFAEACERYLQDKRAFNAPADHLTRVAPLIEQYCDPGADLVLAVSWEKGYVPPMRIITGLSGLISNWTGAAPDRRYTWPWPAMETQMTALTASITMAGQNIRGNQHIDRKSTIRYYDHHLCHAAAACFTSPFRQAACAVVDGHGGKSSCGFFAYQNGRLRNVKTMADGISLGSLGQFYAMLCGLCGFDSIAGEEWKVMGLAGYGTFSDTWYRRLEPLLRVSGLGLTPMVGQKFLDALASLRAQARQPGQPALEMADLAFTGQHRFCELMSELLHNFHRKGISRNLVLGGGCALNSSWNGRVTRETPFASLHVPMAPGDDGNALGAAWLAYYEDHPKAKPAAESHTPLLGSSLRGTSLDHLLAFGGGRIERCGEGLHERVAELLSQGKIVGWARGAAEFGPRALGNRSILADPRNPGMMHILNEKVKFREEFRPFAPSILDEHGDDWFEDYQYTPYMERALIFRPEVRSRVPAVVHVDGTGRLQSVSRALAPDFHRLIEAFHQLTGIPLLLNTSFNVMGKPIIHSVQDAISVFHTTGLDVLVIEDIMIEKAEGATPDRARPARSARPVRTAKRPRAKAGARRAEVG